MAIPRILSNGTTVRYIVEPNLLPWFLTFCYRGLEWAVCCLDCYGEAAFLHGRFVFAAWDVDDMISEEFQERLADPYYLKVGIKGL
jgi:hypothetical protein